jgi:RNA polymerase sigma-70 factor (ECF subfamily)
LKRFTAATLIPVEDWELLSRWRTGDRSAGSTLLARYLDLLARFFRNKVRSDDDVADLVSDALLACSQGRDSIREVKSIRSYLFGVAYRTLRHYYRRRNKRVLHRARVAL